MSRSGQALFSVERYGTAQIVMPRGDFVGFGHQLVQGECQTVLDQIRASRAEVVIVDLAANRYYGSAAISFLMQLARDAEQQGMRTVLCGASPDMLSVLEVMRLNDRWTHYPTRTAALRAEATVGAMERSRRLVPYLAACAVVALCVVAAMAYVRWEVRTRDRDYYDTYLTIWNQVRRHRDLPGNPRYMQVFQQERQERLAPIIADLERTASNDTPVKQSLLIAGRDYLLPLVKNPPRSSLQLEDGFQHHMREAAIRLESPILSASVP